MDNFDWTSFTKKIAIKASLTDIYKAWTVPAELERWFLEHVVFHAGEDDLAPDRPAASGRLYDWYWYLDSNPLHGEIISTNEKDFIQFTFEGNSLVTVSLSTLDEYVIVELRHYNIPEDDHSRQHIRLGCSGGWAFYLHNLKSVYEGGIDLRNKDPKLGVMINN
ncbi:MAG: SRPBCC domain-containing protein [Sphingobacteriales bacterium]|nr:MAG: SRPBCC domain-containing protein [Sphingobacteriales bacterium]